MAKTGKKQPWLKFFPQDWRGDAKLRMCSIGARGLWVEMLCIMHEAEPYGHLRVGAVPVTARQLAALAGIKQPECLRFMAELESAGVYSREADKTIYSRRMVRDKARADKAREDGTSGGNPEIRRGSVPKEQRVRPFKRSDAPEKTRRIFEKSGGRCHWCDVVLIFQPTGNEPNGYHVDHVLPVCDGGSNDENNLVAACAACNHKRARIDNPTPTEVSVGFYSDTKPQKPEAKFQPSESKNREREFSSSKVEFSGKQESEGLPITEAYQPSDRAIEYAYSLGMKKAELESELDKFKTRAVALRQISFDHDMSFKLWCDRWLQYQKKNYPERYVEKSTAVPDVEMPGVLVIEGTLEERCWQDYTREKTGRPMFICDQIHDGRTVRGAKKPSLFPPGYNDFGEKVQAISEEHAA